MFNISEIVMVEEFNKLNDTIFNIDEEETL